MKRLIIPLVILLMCLLCACAYAEKEGLYPYKLNDDNTVTITGFDWNNNHGDIYIPEMLGNRMVSAIGENAFATTGNTAVKITLPDNIRSIGAQAFRGVSITYVNIPLNTTEIGGGAFAECSVMRFNVADGHTVFATIDNSLYNKQTKTLLAWPENKDIAELPNGVKNIGDYVFYGRSFSPTFKKKSYTLPSSIESIGEYSFANTTGISLNASNLSIIKDHAFEEANLEFSSPKLSVIGDYAFYHAEVEFVETLSLSKVGKHAFENAILHIKRTEQNKCLLSKTPYTVDDYSFYQCWGDSSDIIILKNIVSIGAHAFEGLASWRYYCTETPLRILLDKGDLETLTYMGENAINDAYIIRWGNGQEGYHAYADLLNSELTIIPNNAFRYTEITDLKIGPTVTIIGEGAFKQCEVLQQVEVAEGLLTIENEAFSGCKELTAINIPASVTMIGSDVFTGCAETFVVTVEAGSYGEVWARTCGYAYVVNGQVEDTSWLD